MGAGRMEAEAGAALTVLPLTESALEIHGHGAMVPKAKFEEVRPPARSNPMRGLRAEQAVHRYVGSGRYPSINSVEVYAALAAAPYLRPKV